MSSFAAFAIEHAPWIMLGCLLLFASSLLVNIRRSEREEHQRQSAIAEARIVGFLDADGRMTHEPILYPGHHRDNGTLVVYEFQPVARDAPVRGQDTVFQHELARLRVGMPIRVRFNPKLPSHSRLDDLTTQSFATPIPPAASHSNVERASSTLNGMCFLFVALWFVASFFPSRTFVPSMPAVVGALLIACVLAAWMFIVSRRIPARLPETRGSRLVTLWVRPPVYAMVTVFSVMPFFGNLLPAALTRAVGEPGEARHTVTGHQPLLVGPRRQIKLRCSKAEFGPIPTAFVGDEVLCRPFESVPAKGTEVLLKGRTSPLGIVVDEALW